MLIELAMQLEVLLNKNPSVRNQMVQGLHFEWLDSLTGCVTTNYYNFDFEIFDQAIFVLQRHLAPCYDSVKQGEMVAYFDNVKLLELHREVLTAVVDFALLNLEDQIVLELLLLNPNLYFLIKLGIFLNHLFLKNWRVKIWKRFQDNVKFTWIH